MPIAVGYVVAHYYSLLILEGQRTIALLSDPLGTGANWLGTADWEPHTELVTPSGWPPSRSPSSSSGICSARCSPTTAPCTCSPGRAVAGQLPLLALMVAYTVAGLLLLYAG
ncbi:hypothetical protein NKG94_12085 [Micromonospora sp. M12]